MGGTPPEARFWPFFISAKNFKTGSKVCGEETTRGEAIISKTNQPVGGIKGLNSQQAWALRPSFGTNSVSWAVGTKAPDLCLPVVGGGVKSPTHPQGSQDSCPGGCRVEQEEHGVTSSLGSPSFPCRSSRFFQIFAPFSKNLKYLGFDSKKSKPRKWGKSPWWELSRPWKGKGSGSAADAVEECPGCRCTAPHSGQRG